MNKSLIKRNISRSLIIFIIMLFVLVPTKNVKADGNNNGTEITETSEVVEESKSGNYSTLYTALIISILSLGLVFLNKKEVK